MKHQITAYFFVLYTSASINHFFYMSEQMAIQDIVCQDKNPKSLKQQYENYVLYWRTYWNHQYYNYVIV